MHFKLVNTKYSHPLCYDFTLRMILMFQYESGNNTGVAEEISLKTSLKTQLQVKRKHSQILLVQSWLGWVCNFRNQIPHLELSTVWLLIGCLYFYFNTTIKRWDLP